MRRGLRAAALVMALVLLLGTVAAATDTTETTGSIYDAANVAKKNGIQVAPLDSQNCKVKFKDNSSEALTVTYTNEKLNVDDMVIVLLLKSSEAVTDSDKAEKVATTLTAGTIQYIDQADVTKDGEIEFRVFPQNYSNGVIRVIASRTTEGKTEMVLNEPVAAVNREYQMGDVDGNGKVNTFDALAVLKYAVHTNSKGETEAGYEIAYPGRADVNENGVINSFDALAILKYAVNGTPFK